MPKLFKPKIGALANRKQGNKVINFDAEATSVSDSSPKYPSETLADAGEIPHIVYPKKQVIEESQPNTHSVSSSPATKLHTSTHLENTNVDIDAVVSEPNKKSQPVSTSPVKLFAVKQQPRRKRLAYGEPPPPTDKPLDRSTVTLRSLLNWVPINKPPPKIRDVKLAPQVQKHDKESSPNSSNTKEMDSPDHPSDSTDDNKSSGHVDPFAPQVRLDADGNIVLDEGSLLVQRPDDSLLEENRRHVAEEAGLYGTTYNSFRRHPISQRGRRWSDRDTTRFYRCLSTMGTDFYCMSKLFPDRTRTQLLKKYKREERLFPHLVDDALKNKRNYDVSSFYNSESDKEEAYEKITQDVIKQQRKAASKKEKLPKDQKRPCKCDISRLIDEVLSQSDACGVTRGARLSEMIDHAAKRAGQCGANKVSTENRQPIINGEASPEKTPPSHSPLRELRKRNSQTPASSSQMMAAQLLTQTRSTLNL